MKKIIYLLLVIILTSCGGRTVYVWHMNDLIGLFCVLAIIGVAVIYYIYQWVKDKFNKWFNK